MKILRILLIMGSLLTILAACAPEKNTGKLANCPVTTQSQQTFTPPTEINYEGRFWYGTPDLWTNLPVNGIWQELPKDDDGYVQKVVFWREGFVAIDEPHPDLALSGRRLDASATTFSFSDATHGWDETGDFMLLGISIPTEGCWEITAEYKETHLTYVVEVTP